MDPAVAVSQSFLKEGILGTVIVTLMLVCGALWRAYVNSNTARLNDAKASSDKYVALLEKMMEKDAETDTILQVIKDRLGSRRS